MGSWTVVPEKPDPLEDPTIARLVQATNESARHLYSWSVTLLALVTYVLVTLGTIDDAAILVGRATELPLLKVGVPLWLFLGASPIFILASQVNAYMQLIRLRLRVYDLTCAWKRALEEGCDDVQDEERPRSEWFFPFPPLELFLARRDLFPRPFWAFWKWEEKNFRRALLILIYVGLYVLLPLATSVLILRTSVPFHLSGLTTLNAFVVALSIAAISFLFPFWSCNQIQREGRWYFKTCVFLAVGALYVSISCTQLPEPRECANAGWLHKHLDVRGVNLTTQVPGRLDLRDRNLRCAVLAGASLEGADLRGVNLQKADLHSANLRDVSLLPKGMSRRRWESSEDRWRGLEVKSRQRESIFGDMELDCANLPTELRTDRAVLDCADLINADLSDALLVFASLRNARVSDADLQRADLTGADARGAELAWASLRAADLRGTRLDGARLDHGDLRRASLKSARLTGANLLRARLTRADLTGADLTGASLVDVEATEATFPGDRRLGRFVDLRGAQLIAAQGVAFEDSFAVRAELHRVYRASQGSQPPLILEETDGESERDFRHSDLRAAVGAIHSDACQWQLLLDPGVPCALRSTRDLYEKIARKSLQEIQGSTNRHLQTALLDTICGRSVPRLRDLEEAFQDPNLKRDLVQVLKDVSPDLLPEIADRPCAPLDGPSW